MGIVALYTVGWKPGEGFRAGRACPRAPSSLIPAWVWTIYQPYINHIITICWGYWPYMNHTRRILTICWPFIEDIDHTLTIYGYWPLIDHILTIYWEFRPRIDHILMILTIYWPYVEELTICWPYMSQRPPSSQTIFGDTCSIHEYLAHKKTHPPRNLQ